jgi:stage V sporulation protein K
MKQAQLEMSNVAKLFGAVATFFEAAQKQRVPLRSIKVEQKAEAQGRSAQKALDELEASIGLGSVKEELSKLVASLEAERKQREEGLQVVPVSRHMVFTGPPGVGKTIVAHALVDIYRSLGMLRHMVCVIDRRMMVSNYIGQTAIQSLDVCKSALDGILFIEEAYDLAPREGAVIDFSKEAIDTLLKFMEDHRDRIMVIVAGYPNEMRRFIDTNPGLAGRFTKTIGFPRYNADDLCEILRRMAAKQHFTLPDNFAARIKPWITERSRADDWANAREMRTLLEKAREAQAMRIATDPSADLSRLEIVDLMKATGRG